MNLIVCGDSWPNGAELKETEQNFGQLLAEKLNAKLYNQSADASSIPHLILQLQRAIRSVDLSMPTKALFFLTAPDRDVIWSDTLPKGTGFAQTHPPPHNKQEEIFLNCNDPLHLHWYKTYYSNELSTFRCNTSIITLQAICKHHNIQDYYIWGWDKFNTWNEIDLSKFYNQGNTTVFDFFTEIPGLKPSHKFNITSKYIWPNGGHPNQIGHQLIADRLYDWICGVH